jgi:hypothetical protein
VATGAAAGRPSRRPELLERFYPGVPLARPMGEYDSPIANDRVREVLGFIPEFSWRDEIAPESVPSSI